VTRALLVCVALAGCGTRVSIVGAEAEDAGSPQADAGSPPEAGPAPSSTPASCTAAPVVRTPLDVTAWYPAGTAVAAYTVDVDKTAIYGGLPSAHLKSGAPGPTDFATSMNALDAAPYRGKKVRLSTEVKTADVSGWAGAWLRVDGANKEMLAFDNMQDRPITGTRIWRKYEVVLDVPPAAVDLAFGVLLAGSGEVWATDAALEIVDAPYAPDLRSWFVSGDDPAEYTIGYDLGTPVCGRPAGVLRAAAAAPTGFGTYMQTFASDELRGKRVRYKASVKSEAVTGWAGLWMRVDDGVGGMTAFDNMQDRPITGTSDFAPHAIVLDVDPKSAQIAFGLLLDGPGAAWVGDATLEVVGTDVPTTH
jgi:hypothetical protein